MNWLKVFHLATKVMMVRNEEKVELADNPLDYRERRARKGRGNRYNDILFNLKYS